MGWFFDRRGLAPLFTDAQPRSSIPRSLSCYYGMHHGTGMVIPAWRSSNGVFLLLRTCSGTLREALPVSSGTQHLLCETSGHCLILFAQCLPRDRIGGPSV